MQLDNIIKGCPIVSVKGDTSTQINSLCNDSRLVGKGDLFVAVSGCGRDGREHIPAAIEAGAIAIMYEDPLPQGYTIPDEIITIEVSDSRLSIASAADNYYDHPSGKLQLVGVTGTNGKTTTATLLYNLFRSLGYECGLLSTIANYVGSRCEDTRNTTSDPLTINSLLNEMVEMGCEYCFMEVSSIGAHQQKIAKLQFRAGVFSNLTHDHLDYHGTFAEYLRCKQLFFDALPKDAIAITNIDDRNGAIVVQNTKARKITYSVRSMADHSCNIIEQSFEGMLLNIDGTEMYSLLVGTFNAYNLLAIYSTAVELGLEKEEVLVALSKLHSAKGRFEHIRGPRGLNIIIDFAHTPDALENILKTICYNIGYKGELICLFGCGGERDRTKRPEMGEIAARFAQKIILTADNSRSEKTEDIIADIVTGIDIADRHKVIKIVDRAEAIRTAILFAPEGSCIVLAGKGHETYQFEERGKIHFCEREIVEETLKTIS